MLRASRVVKIIRVNEIIEERAWNIFEKYSDKYFSFIDCTSFALMEIENINNVFTFDKHFVQYGFIIMP